MFIVQQHKERPLKWWFSQRENIEVDPPYQRRAEVWPLKDQQFLIDTIINDFDIPKFYVADFTSVNTALDKSGKLYAVVDGKQRFGAIFKFFSGAMVLANNFVYLRNPALKLAKLSYQDLTWQYPEVAKIVDDYVITVMSVITDTDDERKIEEIFVRLNRGVGLSGAETRNAMSGPVPIVVRALANHPFFLNNIRFDVGRGQDLNAAAKLLLMEYKERLENTKKANLDNFVLEAEAATSPPVQSTPSLFTEEITNHKFEEAYFRTKQTLDMMAEVFSAKDTLLAGAGSLPLYYWFVRNQGSNYKQVLREFLLNFEDERAKNRILAKVGAGNVSQELLSYDLSNRSPDDISSLELRYKTLVRRLIAFSETRLPSLIASE